MTDCFNVILSDSEESKETLPSRYSFFTKSKILEKLVKQVQGDRSNAFTLAEILIVLSVIAIITAILLPSARNAMPNQDIMKFKKAHNTLYSAIRELVTSDKYYLDGSFSKMSNGDYVNSPTYFCETFADVINPKKVNCQTQNTGHLNALISTYDLRFGVNRGNYCTEAIKKGISSEITLFDDVVIYQANPAAHFASCWEGSALDSGEEYNPDYCIPPKFRVFSEGNHSTWSADENELYVIYKPLCLDIDGIDKPIEPFLYGIRYDGKIIYEDRVQEWLNKSIQEK